MLPPVHAALKQLEDTRTSKTYARLRVPFEKSGNQIYKHLDRIWRRALRSDRAQA